MNPILVQAAASGVKKGMKDIASVGQKILSEILGCKIKPKGTPHLEIFNKAPKIWGSYGKVYSTDGRDKNFGKSGWIIFDLPSGGLISADQLEIIFPINERRKVEATLRKKCESVTGNLAFYVKEFPINEDRGVVRLSDGHLYVGSLYSLDGGTQANPVEFSRINPIGLTSTQAEESQRPSALIAGFKLSPAVIFAALGFIFAPKILKG